MKFLLTLFIIFFLSNCSKPKTVFICGDHVCVNKLEAKKYFEENLTIEVKILDKKKNPEMSLVQLNLEKNSEDEKERINIFSRKKSQKDLRILSKKEVNEIKKNLKKKNSNQNVVKRIIKNEKKNINNKIDKKKETSKTQNTKIKKSVNKQRNIVDVCTIIEKCSIDEISKYLLENGRNKNFPDITTRQ